MLLTSNRRQFITQLLTGLALPAYLGAATSSTELTNTSFTQAAQTGFVFALHGQDMPNSQCSTDAGSNNGIGRRATARSDSGNLFGNSRCRHTGFRGKVLANGWRVQGFSTNQICEQDTGKGWQTLQSSACSFSINTFPQANSKSLHFEADTTIWGNGFNPRRARLEWVITITGPAGTSPWAPMPPAAPLLISPADNHETFPPETMTFSWNYPGGVAVDQFHLCAWNHPQGMCELNFTITQPQIISGAPASLWGSRVTWRVSACNAGLCTSSATKSFISYMPGAVLTKPPNNFTPGNRNFAFTWDNVYNARRYRLELINPAGAVVAARHISGGMVYGVFGASELSPSEVPPGTYRWTVRAAPAADTNIGFGKPREYRTVVLP